ncbi:MAG: hypothetical protein U5J95_07465 [Balneolaceae bacterium]|nr:hypothetical protein [Balneolaceae bacterium]
MRLPALLLVLSVFVTSCISSEKNTDNMPSYQNLVEVVPPDSNQKESKVYIDSVEIVSHKNAKAFLIQGSFPDGCTKLKSASHNMSEGTFFISLKAWRNPDSMCTQALTPFSFIYDKVAQENISGLSSVDVNGKSYSVQ